MPKPLPFADLDADGTTAKIRGESARALSEALIKKPAETYAELGNSIGIVRPHEISIDTDGSVIISNPAIATELQKRMAGVDPTVAFFDTNCSCNPK